MSKANKGGYQIVDFTNQTLQIDNYVGDGYGRILGEIYVDPIYNIRLDDGIAFPLGSVIGAKLKGFSNSLVEKFYFAINTKKPILISGLKLEYEDEYGPSIIEIDDVFISSLKEIDVNTEDFYDDIILGNFSNFHIYAKYVTLDLSGSAIPYSIIIYIRRDM